MQDAARKNLRSGSDGTARLERAAGFEERRSRRPIVLIVDDEAHLRLLYENELQRHGFDTLSAADGRRCLDNLLSMEIDLVILDVRMPGMDGIDLMGRIRGQDRSIPIIINTAYSSYAANHLTWSADAFVVKSSDVTELVEKVRHFTGRRPS